MTNKAILVNKYTVPIFILLFAVAVDVVNHKGMSRVMVPTSFPHMPEQEFSRCANPLISVDKKWKKGINSISKIQTLEATEAGLETDVYFDTTENHFKVYHDSSVYSSINLEELLTIYQTRKLTCSVWLDFKNLNAQNAAQSLKHILYLREKYDLHDRLLVESSSIEQLGAFCDSGLFTSYYVPLFNPYQADNESLFLKLSQISTALRKTRVSALSGYYFQYPALKHYFRGYPILTWSDDDRFSLIALLFKKRILKDDRIKIVLYP